MRPHGSRDESDRRLNQPYNNKSFPNIMTHPHKTDISVIIVNRNGSEILSKCLDHIFNSDCSHMMEVIVVDNGSSDDSCAMVKSNFPGVHLIEAGKNLGFSKANNLAAEASKGRRLLLVNSDAMLERDCAAKLNGLMEDDPEIAMAGPQLLNEDRSRQTSFEAIPSLATEILNRSLLKALFPHKYPSKKQKFDQPTMVPALIGAVMMIDSNTLKSLNGFDEDYFFFLEETDLALRMTKKGFKIIHVPHARALHLHGATASKYKSSARIEFYRSRYIFFRKHYGPLRETILRTAMILNLALNVIILGSANVATLSLNENLRARFKMRFDVLKWHILGRPENWGLPRD